jgi:potassium-dependent mechanosensitive channel
MPSQRAMTYRSISILILLTVVSLFGLALHAPDSFAGPGDTEKPSSALSPETAKQTLTNALQSEIVNAAEIEQSLKRWDLLQDSVAKELDAYRIQNTAHGNLLLVAHTRIEDLETALNNNQLAIKSLAAQIEEYKKIGVKASDGMAQLADRIAIAEDQLATLKQESLSEADQKALRENLTKLRGILEKRKKLGDAFLKGFEERSNQMNDLMGALQETRRRLEERLQVQTKSDLFQRNPQIFTRLDGPGFSYELTLLGNQLSALFTAAFWQAQWVNFQRSGGVSQAIFLLLFAVALIFRRHIRRYVRSVEQRLESPSCRMRRLALVLLRRSFVLISAAVLLWFYDLLKLPHMNIGLARFLSETVFVLLAARWGIDFLQRDLNDAATATLQTFLQARLRHFLQIARLLAIGNLALSWIAGSGSLLAWMTRLTLEIVLIIWLVRFWRALRFTVAEGVRQGEAAPPSARVTLAQGWSYLVAGGAILLELTGYGLLSGHWLVSWAETLLLALWAHIGWLAIQEWYADQKTAVTAGDDSASPQVAGPVGWFMVQMARLFWLGALLAGALLVWSSTDFMIASVTQVFNLAFSVGSLSFSIKGMLLAVIIVCATHVATRLGRKFLSEKVLDSRDFERGLKDSIITITTYVVWGLGLLVALGILGVNATSLAVVFGALSIGIGFGLQNIFNNFISGLILLFERPIQVGDIVEVGGLWATVKQINVRATVVQTFDNASVIIPNSEFISQQVTNWSFKDPRMRRNLEVGVAYGSDIQLVEQTLLDIVQNRPRVLKYPKPEVLFIDHADSALIFRLRIWVHVDDYWAVPSKIRFDIDRRFRELGIEIAFPQRDLHIRTLPEEMAPVGSTSFPPESQASDAAKEEM